MDRTQLATIFDPIARFDMHTKLYVMTFDNFWVERQISYLHYWHITNCWSWFKVKRWDNIPNPLFNLLPLSTIWSTSDWVRAINNKCNIHCFVNGLYYIRLINKQNPTKPFPGHVFGLMSPVSSTTLTSLNGDVHVTRGSSMTLASSSTSVSLEFKLFKKFWKALKFTVDMDLGMIRLHKLNQVRKCSPFQLLHQLIEYV